MHSIAGRFFRGTVSGNGRRLPAFFAPLGEIMRFTFLNSAIATVSATSVVLTLPLAARAQHTRSHAHAASAATVNRTVRPDLGFSFVSPAEYAPAKKLAGVDMRLIGPQTTAQTTVAQSDHAYINNFLITSISVLVSPRQDKPATDDDYSAVRAKKLLDHLNGTVRGTGLLFNYQNSAKIQVAGQDALAILAETSVPNVADRAMVRIVLIHRPAREYVFIFQAVDNEFETRVPAFENFLNSLKFSTPAIPPAADAPGPGV
jgi:hypothetical protein